MSAEPVGHKIGYFLGLVFVPAVTALIVYFAYLLVVSSDQTRLAVLTAAVSIGTLVYTQARNTRREIEGRQFSKKAEAYEEILTVLTKVMRDSRDGKDFDEKSIVDWMTKFQPKLMIWAGPDVLRAWQRMATPSEDPIAGLVSGNELMSAIRRELGHNSDAQLGPLGLVSTFIKADERPNRNVV